MAQIGDFSFNTTGTYYPMTVTTSGSTAVWNGSSISLQPLASPPDPEFESPTAWLRRRVEEMRVDLREAA